MLVERQLSYLGKLALYFLALNRMALNSSEKKPLFGKTLIGGVPPKPPIGGRSASPKPPAQGFNGIQLGSANQVGRRNRLNPTSIN